EVERLAADAKKREQERLEKERQKIRRQEMEKQIALLNVGGLIKMDPDEMDDLDDNKIRLIKVSQLEKEKKETAERLRITGKRIDHLERAYRREEIALLPLDYEAQRERDLEAHNAKVEQHREESKRKHEE